MKGLILSITAIALCGIFAIPSEAEAATNVYVNQMREKTVTLTVNDKEGDPITFVGIMGNATVFSSAATTGIGTSNATTVVTMHPTGNHDLGTYGLTVVAVSGDGRDGDRYSYLELNVIVRNFNYNLPPDDPAQSIRVTIDHTREVGQVAGAGTPPFDIEDLWGHGIARVYLFGDVAEFGELDMLRGKYGDSLLFARVLFSTESTPIGKYRGSIAVFTEDGRYTIRDFTVEVVSWDGTPLYASPIDETWKLPPQINPDRYSVMTVNFTSPGPDVAMYGPATKFTSITTNAPYNHTLTFAPLGPMPKYNLEREPDAYFHDYPLFLTSYGNGTISIFETVIRPLKGFLHISGNEERWKLDKYPSTAELKQYDPTIKDAEQFFYGLIMEAIWEWERLNGDRVTFISQDKDTNLRISFKDLDYEGGRYGRGDVTIDYLRGDGLYSRNCMVNALMHEIGHSLGLSHTTDLSHLMWGRESYLVPRDEYSDEGFIVPERRC